MKGRAVADEMRFDDRMSDTDVNGMTLGAFTGYFRKRESNKNTLYPYSHYAGHFVLGVIYSKCDDVADEILRLARASRPSARVMQNGNPLGSAGAGGAAAVIFAGVCKAFFTLPAGVAEKTGRLPICPIRMSTTRITYIM